MQELGKLSASAIGSAALVATALVLSESVYSKANPVTVSDHASKTRSQASKENLKAFETINELRSAFNKTGKLNETQRNALTHAGLTLKVNLDALNRVNQLPESTGVLRIDPGYTRSDVDKWLTFS
jgi:hypothetical protein